MGTFTILYFIPILTPAHSIEPGYMHGLEDPNKK